MSINSYLAYLAKQLVIKKSVLSKAILEATGNPTPTDIYADNIPLSTTDPTTITQALDTKADLDSVYTDDEVNYLLTFKADVTVTDDLQEQINNIDLSSYLTITEAQETYSTIATTDNIQSQLDNLSGDTVQGISGTVNQDLASLSNDITLLNLTKADVGNSYSKPMEDILLSQKADKTTTYTKTEVDAMFYKGFVLLTNSTPTPTSMPTTSTQLNFSNIVSNDALSYITTNNSITNIKAGVYQFIFRISLRGTLATSGTTNVIFSIGGNTTNNYIMLNPNTLLGGTFTEFTAYQQIQLPAYSIMNLRVVSSTSSLQYGDNGKPAYTLSCQRVA